MGRMSGYLRQRIAQIALHLVFISSLSKLKYWRVLSVILQFK